MGRIATVVLAVACVLLGSVRAAPVYGGEFQALLPDLVPDAPEDLKLELTSGGSTPPQLLLRFDAFVHNGGPGVLEIRGSQPDNAPAPSMQVVVQREYAGPTRAAAYQDITISPTPRLQFQPLSGHNHFHLWDAIAYYLVGTGESSASLLFDKAQLGFCFVDTEPIEAPFSPTPEFLQSANNFCEQGNPGASTVFMGLSPGWRDVYEDFLPLQYIDVSDVLPGPYRVETVADPTNFVAELNEANNRSGSDSEPRVTVPGYVPLSQAVETERDSPAYVRLASRKYESSLPGAELPGSPQYLISKAPLHGSLVQVGSGDVGAWNDADSYVYVPALGFQGSDSFEFKVRDKAHSDFPYDKPYGHVSLMVR